MKTFELYKDSLLPPGFKYPEKFRIIAQSGSYPQIAPWRFVDAGSEAEDLFNSIREHDGRNVISFAKVDG